MKEGSAKTAKVWLSQSDYVEVEIGENLRSALRGRFSFLYNGVGSAIHCRGWGTCGTCSLVVEGEVSQPTSVEKWRLNFPPHKDSLKKGLRLACQTKVLGDIKVTKWEGLWGNQKPEDKKT